MSAPATTTRQERLNERVIVNTQYAIDRGGAGYFEVHLGRFPTDRQPAIYVTRDRELYRRALQYENDECRVDAWVTNGRPKDAKAEGVLCSVRAAESES